MLVTKKMYKENPNKVAEILGTKKIYSIYDICSILGVTRPTVYAYMRKGLLVEAPHHLGNIMVWKQEDLDQLINQLDMSKRVVVEDVK